MNTQLEHTTLQPDEVLAEDTVVVMPEISDPSPKKAQKPAKKRFLLSLGIYFLVLLVLIAGVLIGLNKLLSDYEASTPNGTLDRYVEWLKAKDYEAIYEAAGFEETLLNPKSSYLAYLERIYAGDPADITLRERAAAEENKKQFSVYFDNTRVSILDLTMVNENGRSYWTVAPQLVYQDDFTIYTDADARVTVNGNDLTLLGIAPQAAQEIVFSGADDPQVYPSVISYTLSGLLTPPTVEALTLDGETCTVINTEKDPQVFRVMAKPDEETIAEQEELAIDAAFTYAKFIARDASRTAILNYVLKESTLYTSIKNFSNIWFHRHDSYSFEDVQLLSSVRYTENDFTCEVQFQPYYVTNGVSHKKELVHYRMSFLLIEGKWKMISLTPVVENATSSTTTTTTTSTNETTTTTIAATTAA